MVHGAADGVTGVEVKSEIRARVATFVPAVDFRLVRPKSGSDGFFCGGEIGPGRSGGDITLAIETLAELIVAAADVLVERVTAALFVAREIVAIASGGASVGAVRLGLRISRRGGCGRRFPARRAIFGRCGLARDKRERNYKQSNDCRCEAPGQTAQQ